MSMHCEYQMNVTTFTMLVLQLGLFYKDDHRYDKKRSG